MSLFVRFSLILALLLTAFSTPVRAQTRTSLITITDDYGTTITLNHYPRRIISLAPNITEILYAIGDGPRVVGASSYSDFPTAARKLPQVISYTSLNLERTLQLKPDLLIAADLVPASIIAKLRSVHLKVLVTNAHTLPQVLNDIRLVGLATGARQAASILDTSLQSRINRVATIIGHVAGRPTVYFEIDPTLYTAGHGSFIDSLITLAGGRNIAGSISNPYPQLSVEKLLSANPEDVVLGDDNAGTTIHAFEHRPGYASLAAVRAGHVFAIDPNLTNRPGPRIVDALENLARILHPTAFR